MKVLRSKGWVCAVLLAAVVPMTTSGCFGRFEVTRKLYRFNRDLSSDRWVRWIGFLAMAIIPVYLVGGILDVLLSNSIEFWDGTSPFAGGEGETRYAFGENGEVAAITPLEGGALRLVVTDSNGTRVLRFIREDDTLAAYDERGRVIARVGDVDGRAVLLGAD